LNSQNAYWVSSQTQHAAEAWKFVQWMTNPTGFFAQNFLSHQFATLAFADDKKLLTDPAWKQIFKIADNAGFRVQYPDPLLKCQQMLESELQKEAATGLKVSTSCYEFATNGWDYTQNFNAANYSRP
jgi:ABC-type glycerol-3-phosphate transport system substrate-binding protein